MTTTAFLCLVGVVGWASSASATWSVIALDRDRGTVVISSATCVPQQRLEAFPARDLRDIQAIVVPGVGVAAAQAGVDRSRANQELILAELRKGTAPAEIADVAPAGVQFHWNLDRRSFVLFVA